MSKRPHPLDDPQWTPTLEAYKWRRAQTDNGRLAVLDLNEALASGRLSAMSRRFADGVRELVPLAFWAEWMLIESVDAVPVIRRVPKPHFQHDFVLYVCKPDLELLWPAPAPAVPEATPSERRARNLERRRLIRKLAAEKCHWRPRGYQKVQVKIKHIETVVGNEFEQIGLARPDRHEIARALDLRKD